MIEVILNDIYNLNAFIMYTTIFDFNEFNL
ncbi:hypothetical protein JOC58_000446 [Paenibacillus hunanensis]|uniref:Uncharacterized protein n=1 Tax=Paenibacillus hunanensis TaxID=539262 RepID=A0ABU1IW14_9BACL|nr:hypothetical protein [Paenibacillus hunanensis]